MTHARSTVAVFLALWAAPAFAQGDVSIAGTTRVVIDGARLVVTGDLDVEATATLDAAAGGLGFTGDGTQFFVVAGQDGQPFAVRDLAVDKTAGEVLISVVPQITGVLGLYAGELAFEEGSPLLEAVVSGGAVQSLASIDGTGATLTGDLPVYERPFLDGEGWRMIASPFDVPFSQLNDDVYTQGATGADVPGGTPVLFAWDPTQPEGSRWVPVPDYTAGFEAGRGYVLYAVASSPSGSLPTTWDVIGEENAGTLSVPLSYSPSDVDARYSLLGNPYAAPLDWHAVQAAGNFQATYAVWDPAANGGSGAYAYYGTSGVSTGDAGRYVPAFGGFWAEATGTSPFVLTYDRAWRSIGESPVFVGRQDAPAALRLGLAGEGLVSTDPLALFLDGAADGEDVNDARWRTPLSADYAALVFLRDGEPLVFDARAEPAGARLSLAVATTRPGTYTLSWPDLSSLGEVGPLSLVDLATGAAVDLRAQETYTFTVAETVAPGGLSGVESLTARFDLVIGASVDSEAEEDEPALALAPPAPNPTAGGALVRYRLDRAGDVRLALYDMLGREVHVLAEGPRSVGAHTATLHGGRLAPGAYLVRLDTGGRVLTRSLTVVR